MASHVVMLPPSGSPQSRSERAILLRDRFSWPAFLVPPLWLLWHRLWLEAVIAIAVMGGASIPGEMAGMGLATGLAGSLMGLLVSVYVGLEGQAMRIAALRRRGYTQWGVVEGGNADEAYIRYAHEVAAAPDEPERAPVMAPASTSGQRPVHRAAPAPSLGLIPYGRN